MESDIPERDQVFHIETEEHFDAIGSAVRLGVLEYFRSRGPMAVVELAELMNRPADGLYHHLKKLEAAGLLRAVATRQRGRQIERIYDATADEYRVAEDSGHLVRIWRLISSHAERTMADALDAGAIHFRGEERNSAMRVETAQLDDEARSRVFQHIQAIRDIFTEARQKPRGEQHSFTFVLQPVVSSARSAGGMSSETTGGTRSRRNPAGTTTSNETATGRTRARRRSK